ncbi:MAG: type VI secretion system tip protein VgrG [Burkholderiales bacterium]|nr:type VI secretion system tip protein VgrG [Burkholderiales bacterium]
MTFDADRRLYLLQAEGALAELLPEAWSLREALNQPWRLQLCALGQRPDLNLDDMLGRRLALHTVLSDGSTQVRAGIVTAATAEESDGGFARYRLEVEAWLALLAHTRRSQVWQEKSLVEIIESVFSLYSAQACWRWADCVAAHLAASPFSNAEGVRSYTVQYRETDLAFVQRLLAEEGLVLRFEPDAQAPMGHTLVILADTVSRTSCPEDACSASALGGAGIRFHRAASMEEQDVVLAFGSQRRLPSAVASAVAWDYKAKRVLAASVPTRARFGGGDAPALEAYDHGGAYAFGTSAQAERALTLSQQAHEARHKAWLGRGTVRSFTPGTHFGLTQSTLDLLDPLGGTDKRFVLTTVVHAGINNLPKDSIQAIAGASAEDRAALLAPWVDAELRAQAAACGYANAFEAQRASVPWRPQQADDTGARLNPRPTVTGPLTATVVGPEGQEIHMDALGRIRIRFDFQTQPGMGPDTSDTSTWVRVLQRHAGAGMGLQFIPRIGQEVLVEFIGGDIDRPLVVGALYDGRGEAGIAPTPGGQPGQTDLQPFGHSSDHRPSAQGNLAGGRSPAWHGASAADAVPGGGQRNAAALSGFKTQEFGAIGYNQLVFDDSNSQLRTQLASTQHATQLNLGHLVHQADNHRGSFRGLGFELRTDAYGAVRAANGLLLSSYGTQLAEPAGDDAAAIALAKQLGTLGRVMSDAARLHKTVALAAHIGSQAAGQSFIDDQATPLAALRTVVSGMVDAGALDKAEADAAAKATAAGDGKLPHTTDPVVALAARAGLAVTAGADLQVAAAETITTASGEDTHWATGGSHRLHTGQAIGMLAGAIEPGDEAAGKGLTIIAAKKKLEVQAQSDRLHLAAQKDVLVESVGSFLDIASPKKISLSVAGGANITIDGNITIQCPGTITVLAGHKSFLAPGNVPYPLPRMPKQTLAFKRRYPFSL